MRRWSELTRVERVGVYTRQSLYLLPWSFNASVLVAGAVDLDDTADAAVLLGGGAVVTAIGFAVFAGLLRRWPDRPRPAWRRVAAAAAAGAVLVVLAELELPREAQGAAVMVAVTSTLMGLALLAGRRGAYALVPATAALFALLVGELGSVLFGLFVGALFVFTVRASLWLLEIVLDLDEASRVKAQLAVTEERLRFSRDVHDVLGRRLSTIAVQAELASTLATRGDPRAAERMLEVRGVAHEALREARELARGYRGIDFTQELEGARSLLRSAGIDVRLRVDDMPRAWHEAAGWVVRESVTNVLRHSDAACVEIAFAGGRLCIDNDGARPAGAASDGTGLRGLRERLAPLGAALRAGADDRGHWTVVAELPGPGPLSAKENP
jgi:two-component system sensor histidine kinase DesK